MLKNNLRLYQIEVHTILHVWAHLCANGLAYIKMYNMLSLFISDIVYL